MALTFNYFISTVFQFKEMLMIILKFSRLVFMLLIAV